MTKITGKMLENPPKKYRPVPFLVVERKSLTKTKRRARLTLWTRRASADILCTHGAGI
ncbi:MAG: hypothetical protein L6V93_18040 [Clostridiales bacterium]|nr:MAG: hypothetical protein L6V93_18040 [Clostridiales bacterium]